MVAEIDPHTLRVVAGLVRSRMDHLHMDTHLDGLQCVGVTKCFRELATDLEITADEFGRAGRARKPRAKR